MSMGKQYLSELLSKLKGFAGIPQERVAAISEYIDRLERELAEERESVEDLTAETVRLTDAMIAHRLDATQAREQLSAALSVEPAAAVVGEPEGWKLVPVEPTVAMIKAADIAGAKAWHTGERMAAAILKAGITAAPSGPEGWKLVPIEPTVEMLGAAADYSMRQNNAVCGDGYYRVMVAAAPSAPDGWQPIETGGQDDANKN